MMGACTACRLHTVRRSIVRGRGALPAPLVVIGEAPGGSEDVLGEAFVGPAGRLLDTLLLEAGYEGAVYMTNVVHCHPSERRGGENREPRDDEILACAPRVARVLAEARPRAVLLAGAVAKSYYLRLVSAPALCILHPSALLREGGCAAPAWQRTVDTVRAFLTKEGLINGSLNCVA